MSLFQRSGMWQDVSPGGAVADFITVFKQSGINRWRYAILAALPPLGIVWAFSKEEWRAPPAKPEIDYIVSFRPGRTEAEIKAENIANQKLQDRLRAEQAKREEEVRQIYKSVGRATGIDVDKIERQAAADRAKEAAAKQARNEALRRTQEQVTSKP